jgi:ubiquinone/menaquinone biosynthesis C-methylase UbiE
MVVQELRAPMEMLREAYRVLEPGGIAAIVTWGRQQPADPQSCSGFSLVPDFLQAAGVKQELIVQASSEFKIGNDAVGLRSSLLGE